MVSHKCDECDGIHAAFAGQAPASVAPELGFGVLCWRVSRGSRALLAVIVAFNLGNLSLFSATVPGPEGWLAGRPSLLTTIILMQIVTTLWAVWWGARQGPSPPSPIAGTTVAAT